MHSRLATTFAIATLSLTCFGAGLAHASELPVLYNGTLGYAQSSPTASPPGANNWSCKPSAAHPQPVILVHGTFANMANSWQALSALLYDSGYCVFALNYGSHEGSGAIGVYAIGPIEHSAEELASYVNEVLAATGANQVDIVGHSQGGMMPRYYLKYLGGASKVHTLVGLAPSNHGTTLYGISTLAHFFGVSLFPAGTCPACTQQGSESSFITDLNEGGETVPGVNYTVIESEYDELITPYTLAFLSGPNVTNITLQAQCPLDLGEHISMPYDHIADTDVLNALDPEHPKTPACTPVLPLVGG